MKVFVVFDAYADSYQVNSAAKSLESIEGVRSVEVLERVAGEVPRYCLNIDIEDDNAQKTGDQLKKMIGEYSSYMSNIAWGAYRKIS